MVSYLIRTRNRPHRLRHTLTNIARTHTCADAGVVREVIVVDDGSQQRLICPHKLPNGMKLRSLGHSERLGWGALNLAAEASDTASGWVVVLADDTCPTDGSFAPGLEEWDESVVAIAPDVFIDGNRHRTARRTSDSLPETLPTAAFAVRREAFLRAGGFDPRLSGPAAVTDLSARLIGGTPGTVGFGRIAFDPRWIVARTPRARHSIAMRSLAKQVREYAWTLGAFAPEASRADLAQCVRDVVPRSLSGRETERVVSGALRDVLAMPLVATARTDSLWERLTGSSAVRATLTVEHARRPIRTAALLDAGRHSWVVRRVLEELGARIVDPVGRPDAFVVGTLSPARMLDSLFRHGGGTRRVIAPWTPLVPGHPLLKSAAAA